MLNYPQIVEFTDDILRYFLYFTRLNLRMINNISILLSVHPFLYFGSDPILGPRFRLDKIGSRDIFFHGRQPLSSSAINSDIYINYIVTVTAA